MQGLKRIQEDILSIQEELKLMKIYGPSECEDVEKDMNTKDID